jgi:hypothetical protein
MIRRTVLAACQPKQLRMKPKATTLLTDAWIILLVICDQTNAAAQQDPRKVGIANIWIDSVYANEYKAALAEHARVAVQVSQVYWHCKPFMIKLILLKLLSLKYMQAKKLTNCI